MNAPFANLNLLVAWIWIGLGFVSGMLLGFGFNREQWLGGYASWKRRLYRLGHISFFGLGMVNLMFYVTARAAISPEAWGICGIGFIVGAFTMPLCCLVAAHFPKTKAIFAVPVLSLLLAALFTVIAIVRTTYPTTKTAADVDSAAATTAIAANGL